MKFPSSKWKVLKLKGSSKLDKSMLHLYEKLPLEKIIILFSKSLKIFNKMI
jgi:hypothetical protein